MVRNKVRIIMGYGEFLSRLSRNKRSCEKSDGDASKEPSNVGNGVSAGGSNSVEGEDHETCEKRCKGTKSFAI